MEMELYKNRSFSACIRAAYDMFSTNFKLIVKRTWIPMLLMAIGLTFNVLFSLPDKGIHDLGMSHPMITASIMGVAFILNLLAGVWVMAVIAGLKNQKTLKSNFIRALTITGISLIIMFLVGFIISFGQNFIISFLKSSKLATPEMAAAVGMGISVLLIILILALSLPFVFSTTKFLIDHQVKVSALFTSDYRHGMRHWAMIFGALFFTGIILTILSALLFIPFFIVLISQTINQLGMLNGDPSGVPSYFLWLLIITTLFTMFIFSFEMLWAQIVYIYVYGSIETKEELKEEELRLKNETTEITE